MEKNNHRRLQDKILRKYTKGIIPYKDGEAYNHSHEAAEFLCRCVEAGDISELPEFSDPFFEETNPGTLSKNEFRNEKYMLVSFVTLVSRAAIRGGMDVDKALYVSDLFIQEIDEMNYISDIYKIYSDIVNIYAEAVAEVKYGNKTHRDIRKIIDYIRRHTNFHLTVTSIAKQFGYNKDYLSHKFKKELGFSLSAFILRTKLEEANLLLKNTDKSLLEISTYLCFSSQSHFQNAYKKQFGITPNEKRNM